MSKTVVCCLLTGDWPNNWKEHPCKHMDRVRAIAGLGERYVSTLGKMVAQFAPEAEFWCFSDRLIPGVKTKLITKMPGYCFEKLYIFSAFPVGTRVLYMDLDTVIVGDMTPLLTADVSTPVFLNDKGPNGDWADRLGAGLFSFIASHQLAHLAAEGNHDGTDEDWFAETFTKWKGWDVVAPGAVLSYKWDVRNRKTPVAGASVVFFHCDPRPHRVKAAWNPHYLELR